MSAIMPGQHPPTPPFHDHFKIKTDSGRPPPFASYHTSYFDNPLPFAAAPLQGEHAMIDEYGGRYPFARHDDQSVYRQYDNYGDTAFRARQNSGYSTEQPSYTNMRMHARLPTPDHSDSTERNSEARHLRSRSEQAKAPPTNKKKTRRKSTARESRLTEPLSELTKHLNHIPIKDTESWVHRTVEERRREVGTDGFIKRPSNSFILYRSAYADRCREYEKSNNHQDISSMAGASWAMESAEVQQRYKEWAKIERENHQAAFPNYKFQPQTQEIKSKKRRGRSDDGSLDESDQEDGIFPVGHTGSPLGSQALRAKRTKRSYQDSSPSLASDDGWGTPESYSATMPGNSFYTQRNVRKPLPAALQRADPMPRFYPPISYPEPRLQIPVTSTAYYQMAPPIGLPGAIHEDLLGDPELVGGQFMVEQPTLDPDLLRYEDSEAPTASFAGSDFLDGSQVDLGTQYGE